MTGENVTRRRVLGTATGLMLVPVGMGAGQQGGWSFEAGYMETAVPLDDAIAFVGQGVMQSESNDWGVGFIDLRMQRLRWWVETDVSMYADLLMGDGALFAASKGGVLKIDLESGRVVWEYEYRGQLRDVVQVGSDLMLVGSDQSEATAVRISIQDGEVSEYRFPDFGEIHRATSRGISSVAVAGDRYVGILDTSDNSIAWGIEYDGKLEWVFPVAPNVLAMVLNTGLASRLIFAGNDGYVKEIETEDPRIQGVVHTDDRRIFAYGYRSLACIDWTTREILWERRFEAAIESVTPDTAEGGGVIVATEGGLLTRHTYSGEQFELAKINESADLGVYHTASYLAWGNHGNGITLGSSEFDPEDRRSSISYYTVSPPGGTDALTRGILTGILVLTGLACAQGLLRFGLEDGRPLGRFEVGERRFAAFLALIGGTFGAHKFYQGRDIAYLSVLFFWTGLPTLLGVYESIKYLRFTDQEYQDHLDDLAERYLLPEDDD